MLLLKCLSILFACCIAFVTASPTDDMLKSASDIETVANTLNASLNHTAAMNTSSMVQTLTWQIGASIANLALYNTSTPTPSSTQSPSSNTPGVYDGPYFTYIDSILTLSASLIRRGQVAHDEANLPVYDALQGLSNVIQSYGFQLGNAGQISRSATIRTLTAGNSIVDAESVWAHNTSIIDPSRIKAKRVPIPLF